MSGKINLKKIQDHFTKDLWFGTFGTVYQEDGVERAIKRLDAKHPDILVAPNYILDLSAMEIDMSSRKSKKLAKQLAEHMHHIVEETNSVGLAANQVGVLAKIMVFRDLHTGEKYTCINPQIIKKDGKYQVNEMCLSLPNEIWRMKRAKRVTVQYVNLDNELVTETLPRRTSLIFQHELDHLDGILICRDGKKINV